MGYYSRNCRCLGWRWTRYVVWLSYCLLHDYFDGHGADLDELLKEDLQRMAAKESNNSFQDKAQSDPGGSSLKELVDKVLIADFFFVLFALGWFGVGVGIKSSSGDSVRPIDPYVDWFVKNKGWMHTIVRFIGSNSIVSLYIQGILDAWLSLWQWVFQPAIGVLMLGAVR